MVGHEDSSLRERQPTRLSHEFRAVPSGLEEHPALARLPHLAQGFLQLLPVGCVAPLQALQLLILFLVQDSQEVLQLR